MAFVNTRDEGDELAEKILHAGEAIALGLGAVASSLSDLAHAINRRTDIEEAAHRASMVPPPDRR